MYISGRFSGIFCLWTSYKATCFDPGNYSFENMIFRTMYRNIFKKMFWPYLGGGGDGIWQFGVGAVLRSSTLCLIFVVFLFSFNFSFSFFKFYLEIFDSFFLLNMQLNSYGKSLHISHLSLRDISSTQNIIYTALPKIVTVSVESAQISIVKKQCQIPVC